MLNNNSLWGQTNELQDLEQQLAEIDLLELTETEKEQARSQIFALWISQEKDWEEKLESCAYAVKCLEKEAIAISSMINDLKSRQQSKENLAKRLKSYMLMAMQSRGVPKLKGKYSTIYTSNTSAVAIEGAVEKLPPQYHKLKIEADKQLLKKDLSDGKAIEGVKLKLRTNLIIRIK